MRCLNSLSQKWSGSSDDAIIHTCFENTVSHEESLFPQKGGIYCSEHSERLKNLRVVCMLYQFAQSMN